MQGKYLVGVIGLMYVQNYVVRRLDGSLDETLPLIKSDVLHRRCYDRTNDFFDYSRGSFQLIDSIYSTQWMNHHVSLMQGLQSSLR